MPRRTHRYASACALAAALTAALAAGAAAPAPAGAAPAHLACPATSAFVCSSVPVPLDRSGAVPGTIQLSVERKGHGSAQAASAVLPLAGGPGQALLPLGEFIAQAV